MAAIVTAAAVAISATITVSTIVTTPVASIAVTTAIVATSVTTSTLWTGLGLINTNRSIAEHRAIQASNSVTRFFISCHLHKAKALALICAAVDHDTRLNYF